MSIFISIALHNLLQAKRRTFLLSLALILVSMFLTILLAFSNGVSQTLIENSTIMSTGHVNVSGFFKSRATDSTPIVTSAAKIRKIILDSVPEMAYMTERQHGWVRVVSEQSSLNAELSGVNIAQEPKLVGQLSLAAESEYREGGRKEVIGSVANLSEKNTVVLFAAQAKKLAVTIGDVVTINAETASGVQNVIDLKVVAVAKDLGFASNFLIFTNTQAVNDLYHVAPDTTGSFFIFLPDISKATLVMEKLRGIFTAEHIEMLDYDPNPYFMKFVSVAAEDWTGQKLDLTIWKDEVSYLAWMVTAIDLISYIIVAVIAVIVALGIFNTVWISVRERTAEIGTMRAIGMQRNQVKVLFFLESSFLAIFSTVLGSLLGTFIALILNVQKISISNEAVRSILMGDILRLTPTYQHCFASVICFTLVTCLAAWIPVRKAASIEPATAIRNAE